MRLVVCTFCDSTPINCPHLRTLCVSLSPRPSLRSDPPLLPFALLQDNIVSQKEIYGHLLKPLFGHGVLYDAHPTRRQQQFRNMAYVIRPARIKLYVPMIERETREFLKSWGESVRTIKRENRCRCPGSVVSLSGLCFHPQICGSCAFACLVLVRDWLGLLRR